LYRQVIKKDKTIAGNLVLEHACSPITYALDILVKMVIADHSGSGYKRRYLEFLSPPEKIASNILADRLKELEATGLITQYPINKSPYIMSAS